MAESAATGGADAAGGRVGAVSAVVCNYNGAPYLTACLDALAALADPVDEIVVVDNLSTDGSLALLAERYPEVRVVRMGSNAGPAAARNAGMRAARNRWVLAVDNDAVVTPELLGALCAAAEAHAGCVIVQPRSVFAHERSRVHYDGGGAHYAGLVALRNFYTPLDDAEGSGTVEVDVAISVCLLVDSRTVLAAGGYDESYFILFEDLDLSYRLRLLGHRILSVEDVLVLHDAGTPGVSFREGAHYPARRVLFHSRNRWLFMLKCFRWRTLLVALPAILVYEALWLAFAARHGGLRAWLRGKLQVAGALPELARKRRAVQRGRRLPDRELLVGGPWTVTPALREGRAGAVLGRLDAAFRAWWRLVRRFAG